MSTTTSKTPDPTIDGSTLSALIHSEAARLEWAEATIDANLGTGFIEAGDALRAIHDDRLYKGTHDKWEDYLRERWDMSDDYAMNIMESSTVAKRLAGKGLILKNEAQTRAVRKACKDKAPNQRDNYAKKVVEKARTDNPDKPLTAKAISDAHTALSGGSTGGASTSGRTGAGGTPTPPAGGSGGASDDPIRGIQESELDKIKAEADQRVADAEAAARQAEAKAKAETEALDAANAALQKQVTDQQERAKKAEETLSKVTGHVLPNGIRVSRRKSETSPVVSHADVPAHLSAIRASLNAVAGFENSAEQHDDWLVWAVAQGQKYADEWAARKAAIVAGLDWLDVIMEDAVKVHNAPPAAAPAGAAPVAMVVAA